VIHNAGLQPCGRAEAMLSNLSMIMVRWLPRQRSKILPHCIRLAHPPQLRERLSIRDWCYSGFSQRTCSCSMPHPIELDGSCQGSSESGGGATSVAFTRRRAFISCRIRVAAFTIRHTERYAGVQESIEVGHADRIVDAHRFFGRSRVFQCCVSYYHAEICRAGPEACPP
jgi:hypothetical protein